MIEELIKTTLRNRSGVYCDLGFCYHEDNALINVLWRFQWKFLRVPSMCANNMDVYIELLKQSVQEWENEL